MNNHGGYLPNQGAVLPFDPSGRLPAHTGLTDVAFGRPAKSDSRFDINEIWRIVAKWWWLITGIAVACLLAAIVISLMITPLYRAQATIEVNPEGVQVVGKEIGEVQPNQTEQPRIPQHPGRPAQEPLAGGAGRPKHQPRQ